MTDLYREHRKEQADLTARQLEARRRDNERRRQAYLDGLEQARQAKAEAARQAAEAALRGQLHAAYMGANPNATSADFDAAYGDLRAEHMRREAIEGPARERRALAATGEYRM